MKNSTYSLLFLIISFCFSCKNSSNQNNNKTGTDSLNNSTSGTVENKDSLAHLKDTINKNNDTLAEIRSVDKWKIDDFIIKKKDRSNQSLRSNIEYEVEQWKNVKNPFIATYKGCDFGDYFHLNFEDGNGKNYDFGFGNNKYGSYKLFNKPDYTDNPKYLGKTFKVYWNWEVSSFPCCDGDYELVEAYLPSITKLELIETNTNKK